MWVEDLRYTARLSRKTPLVTLAIIFTIALGLGATTAIFSVVDAVLLRPLPFPRSDRLMWVAERNDKLNMATWSASALNYLSWTGRTHTFEALGAIGFASFNLTSGAGDPEQLSGSTITASVLPILGLTPVAGRTFSAGDDRPGAPAVVMISEALWKRRFAGSPGVLGQRITLNGLGYDVVGVMPDGMSVLTAGDIWVPMAIDPARERRLSHVVSAIGRLAPGVTIEQAQTEMDGVAASVGREFPEVRDWGIRLVPFSRWLIADSLRTSLWVLLGAIGAVLLIACANVANLLLSRAASRGTEMALRAAMGATRARLVRQLLVESVTLAALGGAIGLALAGTSVHLLNVELPPSLLPVGSIQIDAVVLLFAALVTLGTGVLFGLAPALSMSSASLTTTLKQTSRGSTGGRAWLRNGLAAAELALATVLLVGAGLLGQSLTELQHVPLGFAPDHLLTFQISPPVSTYSLNGKAPTFYASLIDSLRAIPGVRGAAVSSGLPFGNGNYTRTPMTTAGPTILPAGTAIPIDWRIVSPDFFQTMGIPVERGRVFTPADGPTGGSVVIVSERTARTFWGTADPIGRTLRRVADAHDITVVGVVGNVRQTALNQETPAMYYPSPAGVWPRMDVVLRTDGDPTAVVGTVRARVRALDPAVPISTVQTEDEWVASSAAQPRLNAGLVGLFSAVALLIAAVGVYGILAYSVDQRTREIGLRLALGSPRARVLRLIVRQGMIVGLAGIGAGVAAALLLGGVLASLLFGVPARDPATFATVVSVLALVALAACLVPAWRASRVDPMVALRAD